MLPVKKLVMGVLKLPKTEFLVHMFLGTESLGLGNSVVVV